MERIPVEYKLCQNVASNSRLLTINEKNIELSMLLQVNVSILLTVVGL